MLRRVPDQWMFVFAVWQGWRQSCWQWWPQVIVILVMKRMDKERDIHPFDSDCISEKDTSNLLQVLECQEEPLKPIGKISASHFLKTFFGILCNLSPYNSAMDSKVEQYLKTELNRFPDTLDERLQTLEHRVMDKLEVLGNRLLDLDSRVRVLEMESKKVSESPNFSGLGLSEATSSTSLSFQRTTTPSPNFIYGVIPSRDSTPSPSPSDAHGIVTRSPNKEHFCEARLSPVEPDSTTARLPLVQPSYPTLQLDDEVFEVSELTKSPRASRARFANASPTRMRPPSPPFSVNRLTVTTRDKIRQLPPNPPSRQSSLKQVEEARQNSENEKLDIASQQAWKHCEQWVNSDCQQPARQAPASASLQPHRETGRSIWVYFRGYKLGLIWS